MSFSAIHRIMKISCNLRFTAFNKKYKKKQSILKITTKSIIYGNKKQKKNRGDLKRPGVHAGC